jgi:hypothetical protein
MSNELILRQLAQLLAQQGGNVPAPQQNNAPSFFGAPQGGSLFGQPDPQMYAGPITDQKEEMTEERRPDGTVIRKMTKYTWHGGAEWHDWKRKG